MKGRLIAPVFFIMACAGCGDGIYQSKQQVELKVVDRTKGSPVAASLTVAPSPDAFDRLESAGKLNLGSSDSEGRASLYVDTSVIVGGLLNKSKFGAFTKPLGDRVTGEQYFVRVHGTGATEEVIKLLMKVGEGGEGKEFSVEVDSIGNAERH